MEDNDIKWMRYAIDLAKKAWGDTHPNPMVGSVLVGPDQTILTEGFHAKVGTLHAERKALTGFEWGKGLREQSTLYVTLEPCCSHGRTPPCTDIIIEKGIKRVVVGAIDPNPAHQGKGIHVLRDAGIEVVAGVCENECEDLNIIFNYQILHSTPLIAIKTATTLDGKIATRTHKSKWITSEAARKDVMNWRKYFPSIAVGAGTVLADNPSLTIRKQEQPIHCATRIVFDRSLTTFESISSFNVFNDEWKQKTWLITSDSVTDQKLEPYLSRGVQVFRLNYENPQHSFLQFRKICAENGITGVYVEGGRSLVSELIYHHQADYLFHYQAPKIFGSAEAPAFVEALQIDTPDEAPRIDKPIRAIVGEDILTRGYLKYPR